MRSVCVSGNVGTANFEYLLYTLVCELLTALLLRGIFAWLSFGDLGVVYILLFGRHLWVCFEVCVEVGVMRSPWPLENTSFTLISLVCVLV